MNEPENSLHPDLIPALARLIQQAAEQSQVWVVTHDAVLRDALAAFDGTRSIVLQKRLGETQVEGLGLLTTPLWTWPRR